MNEDRFDELLEKCESPIETKLLTKLYPHLSPSHARELEAQKRERITHDGTRIRLDFAFPDLRIAICCDGRSWHEGNPERFDKDRRESRELQLQSWTVLRFSGREINSDSEMVVETIQRAIKRREWYRNRRPQQQQARQQQRTPIPERAPTERPPIERPPIDLRQNDLRQNDLDRTTSENSETTTMVGQSESTAETRGRTVRRYQPLPRDCRNAYIAEFYFMRRKKPQEPKPTLNHTQSRPNMNHRQKLAHGATLNATDRRAESPPDTPGGLNQALSAPNEKK